MTLLSCKKDSLTSVRSQIQGSWELRYFKSEGLLGPNQLPDVSPGNGNRWTFSNSQYQSYFQGQLLNSGTYTLIKKDTYGGAYPATALTLDANTDETARISIKKDTLTMYQGAADGYTAKYVRQ